MNRINQILIEGNLTSRELSNDTCKFKLKVERTCGNNEYKIETERYYFDCVAYGALANAAYEAPQGKLIRVVGRLRQVKGEKQILNTEIVCEHIEFLK